VISEEWGVSCERDLLLSANHYSLLTIHFSLLNCFQRNWHPTRNSVFFRGKCKGNKLILYSANRVNTWVIKPIEAISQRFAKRAGRFAKFNTDSSGFRSKLLPRLGWNSWLFSKIIANETRNSCVCFAKPVSFYPDTQFLSPKRWFWVWKLSFWVQKDGFHLGYRVFGFKRVVLGSGTEFLSPKRWFSCRIPSFWTQKSHFYPGYWVSESKTVVFIPDTEFLGYNCAYLSGRDLVDSHLNEKQKAPLLKFDKGALLT